MRYYHYILKMISDKLTPRVPRINSSREAQFSPTFCTNCVCKSAITRRICYYKTSVVSVLSAWSSECNFMAVLIYAEIWTSDYSLCKAHETLFRLFEDATILFINPFKSELHRWTIFFSENRDRWPSHSRPIHWTCHALEYELDFVGP